MSRLTPAEEIQKIIDHELAACESRIASRITPILRAEFVRARKACPNLKKVLFGNGTCVPIYKGKEPETHGETWPKVLTTLGEACDAAYADQGFWSSPEGNLE